MLSTLALQNIVNKQAKLQPKHHQDDLTKIQQKIVASQSEGYRLERFFLVTVWKKSSEHVWYEGQLEIAVAPQDRVDIEIYRVLVDSSYPHHLQKHYERYHLVVTLPVCDYQLE